MVFLMYLVCLLFPKSGFSRNIPPHDTFSFRYGQIGEYTWRNSAVYHVGIYNEQLLCFSSLLTLEHALTTAGCFVPKGTDVTKMLAYGGTMFYYHQDPRAQVRAVKEVIIHEKFRIEGVPNNDIALVVVTPPFTKTFRIDVALLPNTFLAQIGGNYRMYMNSLPYAKRYPRTLTTVAMELMYFANESNVECTKCTSVFSEGHPYDKHKRYMGKFICPGWYSNRWGHKSIIVPCYHALGCPLMSYNHEIIAMYSMSANDQCEKYNGTNILVRETACEVKQEAHYIQVFPYVDWIKSNIKENRVIRLRPYRIPTKDINLKPYIPIIVYISLFAIVIVVFLICNRAVFGRVRF